MGVSADGPDPARTRWVMLAAVASDTDAGIRIPRARGRTRYAQCRDARGVRRWGSVAVSAQPKRDVSGSSSRHQPSESQRIKRPSGSRTSAPSALRVLLARSVVSRSDSNVCDGSCFGQTQRSGTPGSAVQTRSARRPRIYAEE